ncbi:hypothetical protein C8F04DRAFT_1254975 [Mycena alexandri]|uniref:Uncharacterized protein n=1 Tax=Mycena alexandri TaxID=1745969 RepID=A0AAD6T5Q4_9AGAR|nr:hypothetical protein C8F04DRAFT_1254975 [Mycena alexandri]
MAVPLLPPAIFTRTACFTRCALSTGKHFPHNRCRGRSAGGPRIVEREPHVLHLGVPTRLYRGSVNQGDEEGAEEADDRSDRPLSQEPMTAGIVRLGEAN